MKKVHNCPLARLPCLREATPRASRDDDDFSRLFLPFARAVHKMQASARYLSEEAIIRGGLIITRAALNSVKNYPLKGGRRVKCES